MEFMYTFFKIHDVSDKTQYFRKQEPISAPYVNINDERLIWLVETLPSYVNTLQELSKQSNMKGLTKETHEALIFTAESRYCSVYKIFIGRKWFLFCFHSKL
jgi:hypothetical protein